MYILFDIDDRCGVDIICQKREVFLKIDDDTLNYYLKEWAKEKEHIEKLKSAARNREEIEEIENEYNIWKWTFPNPIINKSKKEMKQMRKKEIDETIKALNEYKKRLDEE